VPWNALVWVGSSILTSDLSASLRSTLKKFFLGPRSGPEMFSTELAVWEHHEAKGVDGPMHISCMT
jgi:hypothetical protein